jgi:carboxymethylenebutenolidase
METIDIPTHDGPMPAFSAPPADGAPATGGAVLVIQEAFGLTEHIGHVVERLAAAGYHAVAPALFHREGSPAFAYDDFAAVMPAMGALSAGGITTDVAAGLDHLEGLGFAPTRLGVVGFCMGGSVALYAAAIRRIGAAVTFYGGGVRAGRFGLPSLLELAPDLQAPWLGLFGDLDTGIPADDVEALRAAAARAAVPTEIVRYPDAEHGFNCDDRASYHEPSATDAWARQLDWFGRHLAG